MRGDIEDLEGFFDDSENIDLPCVILGPGPSLHVDLLHQFDRVLTIGVDETIQIFTPNVWLCTSPEHLHGIAKCLSIMDSNTADAYYDIVSRDWMSCVFELKSIPRAPVLWISVWIARKLGATNIHLDGFDLYPDRFGNSFSSNLQESHLHTPWDLSENESSLIEIVSSLSIADSTYDEMYLLTTWDDEDEEPVVDEITSDSQLRITTYFDRSRLTPIRRIEPNLYWRKQCSEKKAKRKQIEMTLTENHKQTSRENGVHFVT